MINKETVKLLLLRKERLIDRTYGKMWVDDKPDFVFDTAEPPVSSRGLSFMALPPGDYKVFIKWDMFTQHNRFFLQRAPGRPRYLLSLPPRKGVGIDFSALSEEGGLYGRILFGRLEDECMYRSPLSQPFVDFLTFEKFHHKIITLKIYQS